MGGMLSGVRVMVFLHGTAIMHATAVGRPRSGSANPAKGAPTHPGTPIAELSQNRQRKRAKIRYVLFPLAGERLS